MAMASRLGTGRVAGGTSHREAPPRILGKLAIIYAILLVFTFIALAPFVFASLSAFKTPDTVLEYPPRIIPHPWTWSNISDLFNSNISDVHFVRWLGNSLFYAVAIMSLNLVFSSMAAFALARLEFFGKTFWFWITLAVMMIPGQINWISVYIILRNFGPFNLINTYWAIILPAAAQPFSVFLLTQFLKGLPVEIEEAALIDGANRFRIYWQVILPMAKPAMVAAAILSFQGAWNQFIQPLLYLDDPSKFPLTVGLQFFNGQYNGHPNLILAGALFNTVPMVIIFFIFQRYFIQGAATSGLAGR
jgi:ABC-type glycerol-3-phosphate transport system permease component